MGTAYAGNFTITNWATGQITDGYGVFIASATNHSTGAIVTNTGLHIADQTAGNTNYSINTNAGLVHLGDYAEIYSVTNSTTLTVRGASGQTDTLQEWHLYDGTVMASVDIAGLLTINDLNTQTVSSDLTPSLTDTYDLGTSTLLWRKGWLSELDAILFAENTITLLGGWFYVTKDAGTFAADVGSGDTSIDFGKTMTVGDFVVCRAALKVEYFKVGSLVSGTTYYVDAGHGGGRDLDGTGANDWPSGTPFAVLGTSGNGRIELNAYDTPRVQVLQQGATYNAQTEVVRIGDLDGNWNYSGQTWGAVFGPYAAGKTWIGIDATNGIRVANYTSIIGQWDTSGNVFIGPQGTEHIKVTSGDLTIYGSSGTNQLFKVDGSQVTIGPGAGTGNDYITMDPTNGS